MSRRGLLVIGDVVTDVVAMHGASVMPGPGAPSDISAEIVLRPGGSGANTAAWAAHLGASASLLARCGYDSSEWHIAELTKTGVRPHIRVDRGNPTAVVISMVDSTGERSMLTNRGAGELISPLDWEDALLDGVGHLHVSGYTLFSEPGMALGRLAMTRATSAGISISVDPASTGPLAGFGVTRFLGETALAGMIFPNRDEALLLTGADTPERAAGMLSERYRTAVVKLGSQGGLVAVRGQVVARARAVPAEVVDSTGAGDAFAAGYLAAALSGADATEALESGCRAGAECVALVGGRPRYGLDMKRLYPIHTD
ncbi:PfkB family carbohydrate kinase [Nonomuraea sp. MCN248]|uniref:PfkB family carbohydrate kinase n=1 Tax=Nonomuraea corallina TaxID=2989783 RepID=A0ABT4SGE6_9ACTN|nr:PfkB family carbohydrate kinase [Nonomuraea corallina]MDA0636050.1 PfkB family carbohydrate kinase [Nonomuraea corallina]